MKKIIKTAFTLIELLVVIAIIGILSGLIIVSLSGMTQKATIAKAQVFSNSLRNSLLMNIAGEWKLDEGSGTAANDTWTKTNNGTLVGFGNTTAGYGDTNVDGWMSSSNCISGPCLKFDGVDDYAYASGSDSTSSNLAITGAITLSAWVKFNNAGNGGSIAGRGVFRSNAADWGYGLRRYSIDNKIYFYTHSTTFGEELSSTAIISDNNWHLIVATWDGTINANGKKIYIDGILDRQGASTISTMGQPNYYFTIGEDGAGNNPLNGSIDDVRIYNAAMPTSQIKEQYYAGLNRLFANGSISQSEYTQRIKNETAQKD